MYLVMLNQIVLVGRTTKIVKNGRNCTLQIETARSYKNIEGEYEKDYFKVTLTGGIAERAREYLKIGDLVGIKGRLESKGELIKIICEKLTFLSSNRDSKD